ncbi:malto-oligosyltrehalose synthase [Cupriavidus basilensis]|uniref:Malto-oligosyltrehalose synthase n=1 Tax=Cupriavidus basilensis TaxID=68895 RepID=A0A643FYS3_9BURK|nr:malto-oligosyltrehalose synthase [Cupriavidus basilensis]QOT81901.1 malto-oligosyltrehalose synthase [Cupriavidus basilensis]
MAQPRLPPRATARLQLHAGFTFEHAAAQVDYYAALGVSHLYLSPIFCARPGSTHGYDVTDFRAINPELGGEAGFQRFAERAREHGLGLVLDIVPNHMAASPNHNPWWRDVLARGARSAYAHHFDIDWHSPDPDLHGRVLLPILAKPYWEALCGGELTLHFDAQAGQPVVCCGEHALPLADDTFDPATAASLPALLDGREATGRVRLHELLEQQHYRLAWWATAADELNWRRFFEVSDLVGLRVEQVPVFEAVHGLVFQLFRDGWIDGVRVDHVDGLADPAAYCQRLRAHLVALAPERPAARAIACPWLVVEKILAEHETLRADWLVDGTTGYDFMNEVAAVLHDGDGAGALTALWEDMSGETRSFEAQVASARGHLLNHHLVTEYDGACRCLHACARSEPASRDLTLASLRRALAALLAPLSVYRTYLNERVRPREDKAVLQQAADTARATLAANDLPALARLVSWLSDPAGDSMGLREARTRVQQLMTPLAAKATEDTVFYRYGRLLSRNDVGSNPATLALSQEDFHARMAQRAQVWPNAMLATATHDHKRGEDARMRLAVLSELPGEWSEAVGLWESQCRPLLARLPRSPDGGDRLMLYQTLVGVWPAGLVSDDAQGVASLLARVQAWQVKSIREAKRHGNWTSPDIDYEHGCAAFLNALGSESSGGSVLDQIARFARRIAVPGAINSLTQTLVQLTAPGVPDRYQGTEGWDLSLVDPDNRRPVDFASLRARLADASGWPEWLANWQDGRLKLQLIRSILAARRTHAGLFSCGDYLPVTLAGPLAEHALAFGRRDGQVQTLVVGTRLAAQLVALDRPMLAPAQWRDTALQAGHGENGHWVDVLTSRPLDVREGSLPLAEVLQMLPVALLLRTCDD